MKIYYTDNICSFQDTLKEIPYRDRMVFLSSFFIRLSKTQSFIHRLANGNVPIFKIIVEYDEKVAQNDPLATNCVFGIDVSFEE